MEAILLGEKVKLRQDVLEFVDIREWEFCGVCKGIIRLMDKEKGYTLEVKPEEIDWEESR